MDRNPRVIMGLRAQDPVPEWVSHVAVVKDRHVTTGSKDDILTRNLFKIGPQIDENGNTHECTIAQVSNKKVLVDMKNVTVSYHGRKVNDKFLIPQTICSLFVGLGEYKLDDTRRR